MAIPKIPPDDAIRRQVDKILEHGLYYSSNLDAFMPVRASSKAAPTRHRLIVEIELNAIDARDAEQALLGVNFQTRFSGSSPGAIVQRILMCEPIVGGSDDDDNTTPETNPK